jgi:hypothetical protein
VIVVHTNYSQREINNLASTFPSLKIKLIESNKNGIYEAMNLGIENSNQDFLFFLNGGDELINLKGLCKLVNKMKHSTWGYGGLIITKSLGTFNREYTFKPYVQVLHRLGIKYVPHPSSIVRRSTILKMGGFNTAFRVAADQELFIRLSLLERPIIIKDNISNFFLGGESSRLQNQIMNDFKKISHQNFGFFFNSRIIDLYIWKIMLFIRKIIKD